MIVRKETGSTMENIITFDRVSYTYEEEQRDPFPVIQDLSLSIKKGEFVVILGHNGSGKSTLAKLCNGLLQPQSGEVSVAGMNTKSEEDKYEIRQKVGLVFQNPDNQIVATIVEEDVAFGPENLGVEPQEIRRRVDEALHRVDMYEYRKHEPHKLSGGQKQRVAIAGIIAMMPECIVLDEPTAMLDPRGRVEVMQTVRQLNRENGMTVVFITHFMDEAVQADRVVVMDNGKVILDGPPMDVFCHIEQIKAAGLDVPQAAELIHLLRRETVPITQNALTTEACVEVLYHLLQNVNT